VLRYATAPPSSRSTEFSLSTRTDNFRANEEYTVETLFFAPTCHSNLRTTLDNAGWMMDTRNPKRIAASEPRAKLLRVKPQFVQQQDALERRSFSTQDHDGDSPMLHKLTSNYLGTTYTPLLAGRGSLYEGEPPFLANTSRVFVSEGEIKAHIATSTGNQRLYDDSDAEL